MSQKTTLQVCGNALYALAVISSLSRVLVALFFVYSYILGFTAPVAWVQRWFPKMDHYSLDLTAALTPVLLLFLVFWDCVTLWSAGHLRRLSSYRKSMVGMLPAILPGFSPCLILGIPFAFVAYAILKNPQSQRLFAR